jgi:hypothetical protein
MEVVTQNVVTLADFLVILVVVITAYGVAFYLLMRGAEKETRRTLFVFCFLFMKNFIQSIDLECQDRLRTNKDLKRTHLIEHKTVLFLVPYRIIPGGSGLRQLLFLVVYENGRLVGYGWASAGR